MIDIVPVGSVMAYAGDIPNTEALSGVTPKQQAKVALDLLSRGWAYCNGQSLDKGRYNDLYRVIGNTYGDSGNNFMLPDYRGYFLRAVDDGAGLDPGPRTKSIGGTDNGSGSTEKDYFQSHEHSYQGGQSAAATPAESGADAVMIETLNTSKIVAEPGGDTPRHGKETRPINTAVYYIIKIKYLDTPNHILP